MGTDKLRLPRNPTFEDTPGNNTGLSGTDGNFVGNSTDGGFSADSTVDRFGGNSTVDRFSGKSIVGHFSGDSTADRFGGGKSITVLEHVIGVCRAVADEVWVLRPPASSVQPPTSGDSMRDEAIDDVIMKEIPNLRVVEDKQFYRGPLVALAHAWGLVKEQRDLTQLFVVAGDLPGLHEQVLRACEAKLDNEPGSTDAVLTIREERLQPLLGCYRVSAGQAFQSVAENGESRLLPALQQLHIATIVSEEENWPVWWTRPVHTPDDYREWLEAGR